MTARTIRLTALCIAACGTLLATTCSLADVERFVGLFERVSNTIEDQQEITFTEWLASEFDD